MDKQGRKSLIGADMAQQLNTDDGNNQENVYHAHSSFNESAKLTTEEILSSDDSFTDYPSPTINGDLQKVCCGGAGLNSHGPDKKYVLDWGCKLLVWCWRCFLAVFVRLLHACPHHPRDIFKLQAGTCNPDDFSYPFDHMPLEKCGDDIGWGDGGYWEEGNLSGDCRTSGNQIYRPELQIGVSPPNVQTHQQEIYQKDFQNLPALSKLTQALALSLREKVAFRIGGVKRKIYEWSKQVEHI
ncbi:hypothetical protein C5167_021341 [Papaver somniferum]|uniref:Uncharacterized protein n=1 Tax=Papaver somniferum TaxID=3469 RepID=A0A4Y7IYZ1_PAPSO|nr:uncharacterized protein LOC113350534 [Papaver somniferum]RZC52921.1 hypothetical protein C5167_021341 [Papaver somniferum]